MSTRGSYRGWRIGRVVFTGLLAWALAPAVGSTQAPGPVEKKEGPGVPARPLPATLEKKIDGAPRGQPPAPGATPSLRTYPVPDGTAEVLARMLQEAYKDSPEVRIVPLGPRTIAVWAGPEAHLLLAAQPVLSGPVTEVISLAALDAVRVAETLRAMFGGPGAKGPFIEADAARNAIILRGSAEQVQEVKGAIRLIGETGKGGNVRVFTLEQGNAAAMAEMLRGLLTQMRANPVRVVLPDAAPPAGGGPAKKDALPGKADLPIVITALGNRLIVTSEDREALALVGDLIRCAPGPSGEGDFHVIVLQHARAADAARVLEEAFNGRGGAGAPRVERIRVVADPATNSLLIRASPLDLLTIRRLLSKALDTPGAAKEIAQPPERKKGTGEDRKE